MTQRVDSTWLRYPETERFVLQCVEDLKSTMPPVQDLAIQLMERTGSRLVDWLDHLIIADGRGSRSSLAELGYLERDVPAAAGDSVWYHPAALFPHAILRADRTQEAGSAIGGGIQVERIDQFQMMHHLTVPIEGTVSGPYRRACAWRSGEQEFSVVERRGHDGFVPVETAPDYPLRCKLASERWATRPRVWCDSHRGMEHTLELARSLVAEMGTDTAAWIAFEVERAFWQRRNRAGQIQKARQDSLGLGWANHDHHTFRSSRSAFPLLIEILETFGFHARERFYAGAEAGWGAQVMEQPACRLAVFADVDLLPDEIEGDFAHSELAPRAQLGTVGLWCALHGESMLRAGLHHLATRLDFDTATEQLADLGITMMRPFSDFSYLRQAFTRGERWSVSPDHLERLSAEERITEGQMGQFSSHGAIGSHLENIQRGDGFKGFNQQTISDIIRRTDPRRE